MQPPLPRPNCARAQCHDDVIAACSGTLPDIVFCVCPAPAIGRVALAFGRCVCEEALKFLPCANDVELRRSSRAFLGRF